MNDARAVLASIVDYLEARHSDTAEVGRLRARMAEVHDLLESPPQPAAPLHREALATAVAEIAASPDPQLAAIANALNGATGTLCWQVDDGSYYLPGAPVGDGYRHGNMHAVLAEGGDFAVGLFLLLGQVEYRDHRHDAPEFYLNLTGATRWRFDHGDWIELPAGSVLWNEAGAVHATHTGDRPWLSVWAWMRDLDQPCVVVPAPEG